MVQLLKELDVDIELNAAVNEFEVEKGQVVAVKTEAAPIPVLVRRQ